jgi:opacity protein-like surface antigen
MRIVKSLVLCAVILALTAGTANAQERRIHFNIGGGPTFGGGDLGSVFSTGWGPAFGVTFDFNDKVGFQFEYAYRWFPAENYVDLLGGTFTANHRTNQLDFNLVFNIAKPGVARIYAIAGPGAYHREVEITEYVGSGIVCDPWYYICGSYPVTAVIGERGGWDFGFNIGGGVGFALGENAEFYIESRYHFVKGPEIPAPTNPIFADVGKKSSDGHYYPLTFGFRF